VAQFLRTHLLQRRTCQGERRSHRFVPHATVPLPGPAHGAQQSSRSSTTVLPVVTTHTPQAPHCKLSSLRRRVRLYTIGVTTLPPLRLRTVSKPHDNSERQLSKLFLRGCRRSVSVSEVLPLRCACRHSWCWWRCLDPTTWRELGPRFWAAYGRLVRSWRAIGGLVVSKCRW
jgi:hypothetical protein